MFFRNIWSLSPEERGGLKIMIREYAQPEIVAQHYLGNGAHGTGTGDGIRFFEWHRRYLRGLEIYLQGVFRSRPAATPISGLQTANYARAAAPANRAMKQETFEIEIRSPILPYWEPWRAIPPEFLTQDDAGSIR